MMLKMVVGILIVCSLLMGLTEQRVLQADGAGKTTVTCDIVNKQEAKGYTPLHIAAQKGYPQIAKMLLDNGATLDAKSFTNSTPIMEAAAGVQPQVVQLLKNTHADVYARDALGRTALHRTADTSVKPGCDSCIDFLMNPGPDVDSKDNKGVTSINAAALNGYEGVLISLVTRRANVNTSDDSGRTPLINAALNSDFGCLEVLLKNAPNIEVRDSTGLNALTAALNEVNRTTPTA